MSDLVLSSPDATANDPATVTFLIGVAAMLDAKVIVEAGTYRGFTALSLAHACPGATVYSADPYDCGAQAELDNNPHLKERVRLYRGRFEDMLQEFPVTPDLAIIDASDTHTGECPRHAYMQFALTVTRPGGIVCVDDTAADDWPGVRDIRAAASIQFMQHRGLTVIQRQ